jgi:hypothetical protein
MSNTKEEEMSHVQEFFYWMGIIHTVLIVVLLLLLLLFLQFFRIDISINYLSPKIPS